MSQEKPVPLREVAAVEDLDLYLSTLLEENYVLAPKVKADADSANPYVLVPYKGFIVLCDHDSNGIIQCVTRSHFNYIKKQLGADHDGVLAVSMIRRNNEEAK